MHFWHLFLIQMTEKIDFSKISMKMPPILFQWLEMAKQGVSLEFLLDQKMCFLAFLGLK